MTLRAQGSTAMMGALCRTHHAEYDEPKIFDDYLARKLITIDDRAFLARLCTSVLNELRPDIDISNSIPIPKYARVYTRSVQRR